MKKEIVAILICILLIVSSLVIVYPIKALKVSGNTLYVGGSGLNNYSKIVYALENASTNDTIFVYSGTYFESFLISKSIHLIGEDKYTTIIDARSSSHVIEFGADWITVSGFTITNSSDWAIVNPVFNSKYYNITDNIFMNNHDAIFIGLNNFYNDISNNTIIDGGIYLWGSSTYNIISHNLLIRGDMTISGGDHNIVINNTIENGGNLNLMGSNIIVKKNFLNSSKAIVLSGAINNTIQDNELIDSEGISIIGNGIIYWNTHTIKNNSHNGRPILFYKNQDNITIPSNAAQVILANCKNCLIKNLNITNVKDGIQLGFSTENTICFNKINNNSETGILLWESNSNNINNNTIEKNLIFGIKFKGTTSMNKIFYNEIINNGFGIYYDGFSERNDIQNNKINDNSDEGIYIHGLGGTSNIINKNSFKNNNGGIFLDFSYYNIITNNNFINNNKYHVFYKVNYFNPSSNFFNENYYDDAGFLFKIIFGYIKTRFYWEFPPDYLTYFYRPGFEIDWHPAKVPNKIS